MKKFQIILLMVISSVVGIGIGYWGKTYITKPVKAEPEKTLEEKILSWIISDKNPENEIKAKEVKFPVSLFPADSVNRYFSEDEYESTIADKYKNKTIIADEIDLDDDGQPELLVYSGHGNRNVTYDIFKKINGKWQECGSIGGVNYFFVKHNGKTGAFEKWALGYAGASYSFYQFVDGEQKEIISFVVDGREKTDDGKKDKIIIELRTDNNFMKKQHKLN